ncbi:MAG TPA: hypothetical protein DEU93_10535, partial [Chitinophagaceae bacterium]|nr:hypothetical protein [Chitinophagaceae bacterium]
SFTPGNAIPSNPTVKLQKKQGRNNAPKVCFMGDVLCGGYVRTRPMGEALADIHSFTFLYFLRRYQRIFIVF